jgi:uracil-DNA glycosylase
MPENYSHHCDDLSRFPLDGYLQRPCTEKGAKVLIVGESLASKGWRVSGQACYDVYGKRLRTGETLNTLLRDFDLSVESCGFTDLAKCYVEADSYQEERKEKRRCADRCWPIFAQQLKIPYFKHLKLLILLGGITKEVFEDRTKKLTYGRLEAVKIEGSSYTAFPIYHPGGRKPILRDGIRQQPRKLNQEFFNEARIELNALLSDGD